MELIYKDQSYALNGACFKVYKEKGNGFVEPVHLEFMELELISPKIPFTAPGARRLTYKGFELKHRYIPDFLCYQKIVAQLKAVKKLTEKHCARVLNYLKGTGLRRGLLANIGHYPKFEYERIIL